MLDFLQFNFLFGLPGFYSCYSSNSKALVIYSTVKFTYFILYSTTSNLQLQSARSKYFQSFQHLLPFRPTFYVYRHKILILMLLKWYLNTYYAQILES